MKQREYCSSCQLLSERDRLQQLIETVEESQESDDMILSNVSMPGLFDLLAEQVHGDFLEKLMITLYKKRKSLALSFYQMIHNSQLHIPFLHLLRSHDSSDFCKVFLLLVSNSRYNDTILPFCCLKCYTSCIVYSRQKCLRQQIFTDLYMLLWGMPSGELFRIFQRTIQKPEGLSNFQVFCNGLIESTLFHSPEDREHHLHSVFHILAVLMRQHPTRFPEPILHQFPELILSHPLLLSSYFTTPSPWRVYAKSKLKKRLEPFHEELIAKSWHPSRFQHWCEDMEEQKFNMEQGIQGDIPILRGDHALWNIRWI